MLTEPGEFAAPPGEIVTTWGVPIVVPAHAVVPVSLRRVKVIVPPAVADALLRVAVSCTVVPMLIGPLRAALVPLLMMVVDTLGVKKMAEVLI